MKTPTASSATSSQREQTFLLSQVPRSPRSSGCSTPGLENPSASVHPKRFSTPSLTPKFLCAGKLNPRPNRSPIFDVSLQGRRTPTTPSPPQRKCLAQRTLRIPSLSTSRAGGQRVLASTHLAGSEKLELWDCRHHPKCK